MNGNWSIQPFRNLNCLSCNSQFYIKGFTQKGSRCPWLLKCGHSLCSSCIKQNLKISNTIACPQCHASYTVNSKSLFEHFSLNLYMMGTLTASQIEKHEKDRKLALLATGDANFNYSVKGKQSNPNANCSSVVCEECLNVAFWSCENCQCHFCDHCWSMVHGAAKSLMKHVKLPVTVLENMKTEYDKCPSHDSQDLELFCKSCRKTVCTLCVIQSHQGVQHSLITMKEQNSEMVSQLKTVAEEAEMICKRMKHTLEKIKYTQNSPEIPNNQSHAKLRNEILGNFARLHGLIQLQEEKFLKQLYNKSHEREKTLGELRVQLETQIQKTELLLEKYEAFVKKPQVCDLNILHDQLSEVKIFPCYFISQKCDAVDPKVSFNESVIDLLENYCSVELPSNEVFELRCSSDLPEDFAVEPLSVSSCDQRNTLIITSGSNSDLDTISNCSSRDSYDGNETPKLNPAKKSSVFCEGGKYSVHITYIINPGEFYVTLNSQRKIKENIEKRAATFGYPPIISSTISKDDLYLVKYKVDGKWYRGRIVEVFSDKKGNQTRAVVHYIDYGNTDTVPVAWVKSLSPDLTEDPPLAMKCKLFNCVPKNGKWSKDSVKIMEKIVNGLTATLFVMKIHPDCLEVDLSVIYPDGQIGRDIVSVRDALVFLEFASFVGGTKVQDNPPAAKYKEQCLPSLGECFDVVITHVNSPDDFYLHRTKQDGLYLCKLGAELQNYYNENPQKGIIYNPAVGVPCAAKFSADQKWYRAIIDDLPGRKLVTVFYVDYGNKENIPWMDIRKLRENFVKRPPLAIKCSLSQIQSKFPDSWNPQAKAYLKKCILTKNFWVQVDGVELAKAKLNVLLYHNKNGTDISVNSLFVDMGFTSFPVSESVSPLKSSSQDSLKTPKDDEEDQENSIFTKNGKIWKHKLSAKQLRQNYESEKRQYEEDKSPPEDDSGNSEISETKDRVIKVKVEVLSAESPSCIYVTFSKGNEDFKNLQTKLDEFYENTTPSEELRWTVDSKCAVFYSEKNCWCRASISKVLRNGTIMVFLKDFAITATVPKSSLRVLDPSFTKYGPRAIKCHLAYVAPPGDTWPGISCEYLAGELEGYSEVYMTKRGQIENNSLPIELWVQKIIPASALEPTNVEWTTLNKLLVEKGLAVLKQNLWYLALATEENGRSSDKEDHPVCEKSENVEETTTESTTFLPSLSSQWLPANPLTKSEFVGISTYVDSDGIIYVQDIEDQKTLLEVRDSLEKEYRNSKPNAEDHFWSPGQMCIVRYFADNYWYRGVVLETSDIGNYKVLFVDYGNVENCRAADLRKKVKMTELPILVHKVKLYGVVPVSRDGKWPLEVIEVIHSLVVDEKCLVTVLDVRKEPYGVMLNLQATDQDMTTLLMEERLVTQELVGSKSSESSCDLNGSFFDETKFICGETDMTDEGYVPLNIPKDCEGLHVLVKALRNENNFYGHIVDSDCLPLNLKNELKQFKRLEETLAEECHLQPKLENIAEGKPCCCVHSGINKWCRGLVETVTENCVCIFYVDYGYMEFLSMDLVHECKLEWQKLPQMAVKFHIPNLEKNPTVSKAVYMKALTTCLMENKFYAQILHRNEDFIEVELFTEKDKDVAYKIMMDNKLIKST